MLRSFPLVLTALFWGAVSAQAQQNPLSFRPVAAEYSTVLDRMIMVSANPNQLHIYDAANQSDTPISLGSSPLSVSISPDGLWAAVGHTAQISYVSLSAASVKTVFQIPLPAQYIVLSANWIYVMPTYVGSSISLNIATGAVTNNPSVNYGSGGRLNPVVNAIYGDQQGITPDDVLRYDISTGPITKQTTSPVLGYYPVCAPIFFSADGTRIYSGCGTVFHASSDPALDRYYLTTMVGVTKIGSLSESAKTNSVALVQAPFTTPPYGTPPIDDTVVSLYESSHLNPIGKFTISSFQVGSGSYKAHGKSVFFNAAGTTIYVLNEADSSSGILNDYAVQAFPLAASAICSAAFQSDTAESNAAGGIATVNITADPTCVYSASTSVPWIQIISGGYGSGNGTLSYIVRQNSGDVRSGSISLGSNTFTVTQDNALPSPSLMSLPYNVVTATFDKPMDRLILASANPNELHVYDPGTGFENAVPLSAQPLSVSVSPDGNFAAVGLDGWVDYVDLQGGRVLKEFPVITDVHNVLLAGNGYAYLFTHKQPFDFYSLQVSTGTIGTVLAVYAGGVARLFADGQSMYIAGLGLTKWSLTAGVPTKTPTAANISPCGSLWLTEDGRRLLTACGGVYRTSNVSAEDLQANGSIASSVTWADHSAIAQQIAVIPGPLNTATQPAPPIQMYGDAFLDYKGFIAPPQFTIGGSSYKGFAQFVFWNRAANSLIAVEKIDPAAGLLSSFAVSVASPSLPAIPTYTIPTLGSFSVTSAGSGDSPNVGSAQITPAQGSVAPAGLAIFAEHQNGILVSEATVPAVAPIQTGRIFVEVSGNANTGLAISNPNSVPATISFYLTDQTGKNVGTGSVVIPANGQISAFLNQPPFNVRTNFTGTFTFTSIPSTAAVALRLLINERGESIWTTLPVINPNLGSYGAFASFVDGGGWSTEFVLVNPSNGVMKGALLFHPTSADGSPSSATVSVNGQTATGFSYSVPANSSQTLKTSGSGSNTTVGWASLTSSSGGPTPTGMAIISETNDQGTTISQAGLPVGTPDSFFGMYAEGSSDASQIRTGIAAANLSSPDTFLNLDLRDLNGNSVGTSSLKIPANGQRQMFLNEIPEFKNLPAHFQGVLNISSFPNQVVLMGLRSRYNERGEFLITSVNPVMNFTAPANPPLIFPQVADGGGFTTQFILYNPFSTFGSGTAVGTIQLFTQSGLPLVLVFQ